MLALLLGIWLSLAQQGTAVLQGTVKRVGTSEPIGGVEITLVRSDSRARFRANSDAQGGFLFENLPLGNYSIQASREGYFTYPQGRALPSQVASLTVDSTRTQLVVIDLMPGAAIGGRITDPEGRPLQGVQVSAMKLQYDEGQPSFGVGSVPRATDDRGEYRLFWF